MGNCLPFLHLNHYFNHDEHSGEDGDLTRLNRIPSARSGRGSVDSSRSRQSGTVARGAGHSRSVGQQQPASTRQTTHRHASSYVNELYITALRGEASGSDAKPSSSEEKRRARVLGLLEQLPIDTYVEGGKARGGEQISTEVECAICMVDFIAGDPIRYLPCMHCYHLQCIDDWLLRSFTCPSCMEPVDSAILSSFNINATTDLASLTCSPAAQNSGSSSKS